MKKHGFVRWFNEIGIQDVGSVGGKNASLGEMYQNLTQKNIRVPNGFAVTAEAYFYMLESANLADKIREPNIRQLIAKAKMPSDLESEIVSAYRQLGSGDVAVRSSATAEDLPTASFAGQQESFLNIRGEAELIDSCMKCFASLFTDRAISYRHDQGFDDLKVGLSIGVQMMVQSDVSGIMFSIDTETGFRDVVVIDASYGLGENIVQGAVNPDEFQVFKPTLKTGFRPILKKRLGSKELRMIYDTKNVKNLPVAEADRKRFCILDDDVLTLARWACVIEDHYSALAGRDVPMDMEWAKDGVSGELFIVQARPETVRSVVQKQTTIDTYHLGERSQVLIKGRSVGGKVASGPVRVISSAKDLNQLQAGDILVTDKTDPDWEPAMKKIAAVITNRGGRTCHAAIVSRELGLPAIVGTQSGTETLKTGQVVTVSCAEGETGFVYEGKIPFTVEQVNIASLAQPKTQIMMNLANPDEAFRLSFLPNSGVGLARMEFIISHSIKIHPMALLHFDQLTDLHAKSEIERLTQGYSKKSDYFVDQLAQGVAMLGAAFFPKDVIVRLSDFKTNEYANLVGGKQFEPEEENPMLGFRGASRYYDPKYRDGFALECQAMKKVRDEMGLTNVKLMVPFCRTVEEGRKVIAEIEKNDLKQGEKGLEIYVMCEIPSNVILADQFADIFDGFSIGSNDLTQLILGVDRDSEMVAHIFDERNEAVKEMISQVICIAHAKQKKIGICGQAPSDYPEFARFLVEEGIDSISLNPDVMIKTTLDILKMEKSS